MAVKGDLQDMNLTNIISINCNERNQARLFIRNREREAVVFFEDGQIVHANLDSQTGEDVIYEILTWDEGEFELEQGVSSPMRTVTAGWSAMLLEGMRRIDESTAGWEVEWDGLETQETKRTKDNIAERMVRGLKRIVGIEGALICSQEGRVLSQETSTNPVKEAGLAASVGRRAEAMSAILDAGRLKQAVMTGDKRRVMVVTHEHNYVVVSLALRTSAESMVPVIQMTLRRYR